MDQLFRVVRFRAGSKTLARQLETTSCRDCCTTTDIDVASLRNSERWDSMPIEMHCSNKLPK